MSLPVGPELDWVPARRPQPIELRGSCALLRPVRPGDAQALYPLAHAPEGDPSIWTYLPDGPFESPEHMTRFLQSAQRSEDPLWFTLVRLPDELPLGIAAYQRIDPDNGVIEIGRIWYGPPLKRTTAATELIYLLARHAFDELGYRRFEWKCDALNAASRSAAERYGFRFEGIFQQHMVVRGRNRDTAWFSITDREWPAIRGGFEAWLAPENFDREGGQRRSLRELIDERRRSASK
jgi:RimJ/RimL family protein N-acetyltransferase